jgi:hypothetical protein
MNTESSPDRTSGGRTSLWRTVVWSVTIAFGIFLFSIGFTTLLASGDLASVPNEVFGYLFLNKHGRGEVFAAVTLMAIPMLALIFGVWFVFIYRRLKSHRVVRAMIAWLPFLAVLTVIAAIAIPSHVKARNTSQQNACISNLRMIDAGKEQCAMVYRLTDGDKAVTASVNEYVKGNTTPICCCGGTYSYGNIGSQPECSITTPTSHIFGGGRY